MSGYSTAVTGNVPANVPITFTTNAGVATPAANNLNIVGAGGTSTSGAGNTVTITTVTSGLPWTDQNANFAASGNNGYFCTAALTATLPAVASQGNMIIIEVDTANPVVVQAAAGQTIRLGSTASSVAGSVTSTSRGDTIFLIFRSASSTWFSISTEGTWAVA